MEHFIGYMLVGEETEQGVDMADTFTQGCVDNTADARIPPLRHAGVDVAVGTGKSAQTHVSAAISADTSADALTDGQWGGVQEEEKTRACDDIAVDTGKVLLSVSVIDAFLPDGEEARYLVKPSKRLGALVRRRCARLGMGTTQVQLGSVSYVDGKVMTIEPDDTADELGMMDTAVILVAPASEGF